MSLKSLIFLLISLMLGCISFQAAAKSNEPALPLEEDPEVTARYDFSGDSDTSFFNLYFSTEPGDPVDFEDFYGVARMAFLFGFYETALEYWRPLAFIGYAKAEASLGWMYQTGKGVKQDYKEAYKWYRKAARQDHPIAQNNLGVLFEKGWGVKKNYKQAVKWYKESAEWGYSYGQYNYGKMLREGRGVKRNRKEADYWLDLASIQRVKQADALLGRVESPALSDDPGNGATALKKEVWIMLKNPRYFTLQLMVGDKKKDLQEYIKENKITGQFAYYTVGEDKKKQYKLIYGVFPSFTDAEKKMRNLPKSVLKNKPWIRKFKNIQDEIKQKTVAKTAKEDKKQKQAEKPKTAIPDIPGMGPPIR